MAAAYNSFKLNVQNGLTLQLDVAALCGNAYHAVTGVPADAHSGAPLAPAAFVVVGCQVVGVLGRHDPGHVSGDKGLGILQKQGVGLLVCAKVKTGCRRHRCRRTARRCGRDRLLLYRVDGSILAGLGVPEGGEHLIRKLVVIHGDELIAGQKRFRGQPLFSGLGLVELLCQQMAFLQTRADSSQRQKRPRV